MSENKIKVIANLPNGYECNNRIYSPNGGQDAHRKRLEGCAKNTYKEVRR